LQGGIARMPQHFWEKAGFGDPTYNPAVIDRRYRLASSD
jgi:hypothetical protein